MVQVRCTSYDAPVRVSAGRASRARGPSWRVCDRRRFEAERGALLRGWLGEGMEAYARCAPCTSCRVVHLFFRVLPADHPMQQGLSRTACAAERSVSGMSRSADQVQPGHDDGVHQLLHGHGGRQGVPRVRDPRERAGPPAGRHDAAHAQRAAQRHLRAQRVVLPRAGLHVSAVQPDFAAVCARCAVRLVRHVWHAHQPRRRQLHCGQCQVRISVRFVC